MEEFTVGEYLIERLLEIGINDIFGVPGDFVLGFMDQIVKSKKINLINTCNELNAAYAADGYARIKGIGCVCTTFGVGELSAINGVAGSYAEMLPVVNITGSPSSKAQKAGTMLHHTIGNYNKSMKMFKNVTVASTNLMELETACDQIDRCLIACMTKRRPVYISIPSDITHGKCRKPHSKLQIKDMISDESALNEVIDEAVEKLNKAEKPIIIADAEIQRYGAQEEFLELLKMSGIPFTTLMMGKTQVPEQHEQFIGLYMGDRSRDYVRKRVEEADVVLTIGLVMSDLNTGGFTLNLKPEKEISMHHDTVRISNHYYEKVNMKDVMKGIAKKIHKKDASKMDIHPATQGCAFRHTQSYEPKKDEPLKVNRFFSRMASFIPKDAIVIAETGVSLFGVAEILMPEGTKFIGQVFYGSIGFTIGATLGVCVAAPHKKVILFVGDGSFQVTAQDVSSMIRYKLNPTIFLLNNDGYTIERLIIDGIYNDIQPWKYHTLPAVFGGKIGMNIFTEGELENSLDSLAKSTDKALEFVEVHLDRMDSTESLAKAGSAMASSNDVEKK